MASAFLLVRARDQACALPVACVVETMRPRPLSTVANAPACVLGIAVVRGEPIPVVDLALLIGTEAGPIGRFVTVNLGPRRVALAVSSVEGLTRVDGAAELPALLRSARAEIVSQVATLDHEFLAVLDPARLADPAWERLLAGSR